MKLPKLDMDEIAGRSTDLLSYLLDIRDRAVFVDRATLAELDKAINLQRRGDKILRSLAEGAGSN